MKPVLLAAATASALLLLVLPAHVDSQANFVDTIKKFEEKMEDTMAKIRILIREARDSVRGDIIEKNKNNFIFGMANFLGMLFGIAGGVDGNPNSTEWSISQRIQVAAQTLYGYGYAGPFLMELEDKTLECGDEEGLNRVLDKYSYMQNLSETFSYLDGYDVKVSGDPRKQLADPSLTPIVMQYYAVELNHAMQEALFCIIRKAGRYTKPKERKEKKKNFKAVELLSSLNLYTMHLEDALKVADREMQKHVAAFRELQKEER